MLICQQHSHIRCLFIAKVQWFSQRQLTLLTQNHWATSLSGRGYSRWHTGYSTLYPIWGEYQIQSVLVLDAATPISLNVLGKHANTNSYTHTHMHIHTPTSYLLGSRIIHQRYHTYTHTNTHTHIPHTHTHTHTHTHAHTPTPYPLGSRIIYQ